jgi:hypothetical protein
VRRNACDDFLVRASIELPDRLARLHRVFAIQWFTSWDSAASWELVPFVGLPEGLPVIDLGSYPESIGGSRGSGIARKYGRCGHLTGRQVLSQRKGHYDGRRRAAGVCA